MKKIVLMITLLLTLILLVSCDNNINYTPNLGNKVDSVKVYTRNDEYVTVNSNTDVYELMNLIKTESIKNYELESTFSCNDIKDYTVYASYISYDELVGEPYYRNFGQFYSYATTTKNMTKFEMYQGGNVSSDNGARYLANGIPLVAFNRINNEYKTLANGYMDFPIREEATGLISMNYDNYLACKRIYAIHNRSVLLSVPTKNLEYYNDSFELYENYVVFKLENSIGSLNGSFHDDSMTYYSHNNGCYLKGELYYNVNTCMVEYYCYEAKTIAITHDAEPWEIKFKFYSLTSSKEEVNREVQKLFDTNKVDCIFER